MDIPPKTAPPRISLAEAFRYWLKLGFISFGGPAGQIAIMHQALVEKRRLASNAEFAEMFGFGQIMPGPAVANLAMVVGYRDCGAIGGSNFSSFAGRSRSRT